MLLEISSSRSPSRHRPPWAAARAPLRTSTRAAWDSARTCWRWDSSSRCHPCARRWDADAGWTSRRVASTSSRWGIERTTCARRHSLRTSRWRSVGSPGSLWYSRAWARWSSWAPRASTWAPGRRTSPSATRRGRSNAVRPSKTRYRSRLRKRKHVIRNEFKMPKWLLFRRIEARAQKLGLGMIWVMVIIIIYMYTISDIHRCQSCAILFDSDRSYFKNRSEWCTFGIYDKICVKFVIKYHYAKWM